MEKRYSLSPFSGDIHYGVFDPVQSNANKNETQAPHIFFFTLLDMLGNYEPTCIVTIKIVTM